MKKSLIFILTLLFFTSFVFAADCSQINKPKNTQELLNNVGNYNSALSSCSVALPSALTKVLKNGVLLIDITDLNQQVYVFVSSGNITGVSLNQQTKYSYSVKIESCVLDGILSSPDSLGAFASYYLSGQAKLSGGSFFNKLKLWIASPFLKGGLKQAQVQVTNSCNSTTVLSGNGKPENCYETYMEGHEAYQYAKEEWDKRKAETKGVCQTQTAEAPKGGNCVYLFEEIKNNDKKWVCWYK